MQDPLAGRLLRQNFDAGQSYLQRRRCGSLHGKRGGILGRELSIGQVLSCRAGRPTGLPTLDGIGRKDRPMEGGEPSSMVVLHGVLRGETGARQRETKSLEKNFFLKITENQRPSELVQDLPPLSIRNRVLRFKKISCKYAGSVPGIETPENSQARLKTWGFPGFWNSRDMTIRWIWIFLEMLFFYHCSVALFGSQIQFFCSSSQNY